MAIPQQHDLTPFVRGDSYAIPVDFKREGNAEDLTDWVLWFTVKNHPQQSDDDAVIQKQVTITGSSAVITLTSDDTANLAVLSYHYDLQLVSPAGDAVKTLVMGKLTLLAGVTDKTQLPASS